MGGSTIFFGGWGGPEQVLTYVMPDMTSLKTDVISVSQIFFFLQKSETGNFFQNISDSKKVENLCFSLKFFLFQI